MAVQMFGEVGSFGALALGVDQEEVEVVLPEPTIGSKVRRVVWGKLVAERCWHFLALPLGGVSS